MMRRNDRIRRALRGVHVLPEVDLPPGHVPPSAAVGEPPSNLDRLDWPPDDGDCRFCGGKGCQACSAIGCDDPECRFCSPAPVLHDIPEGTFDRLPRNPPTMADYEADTRRYLGESLDEMRANLDAIDDPRPKGWHWGDPWSTRRRLHPFLRSDGRGCRVCGYSRGLHRWGQRPPTKETPQ